MRIWGAGHYLRRDLTALLAGLQATGARSMADFNRSAGTGANRYALAAPSCQILQPAELRERCATLTKLLVQNIGQTKVNMTN